MSAMKHLLPKNLDELSSDALCTLVQQQAAVLAYKDKTIKELELTNSKLKSLYPYPRWLIGWVNVVMPCMRMKPPSRSCVRTKTEKHTGPTSGPMPRRFMKGSMPSFTTLPQAGQALMPAPSWLTGKASSSPMTTAVTNKASSKPG